MFFAIDVTRGLKRRTFHYDGTIANLKWFTRRIYDIFVGNGVTCVNGVREYRILNGELISGRELVGLIF